MIYIFTTHILIKYGLWNDHITIPNYVLAIYPVINVSSDYTVHIYLYFNIAPIIVIGIAHILIKYGLWNDNITIPKYVLAIYPVIDVGSDCL